jgi:type II secretory pathway pseudopilin PulG
VIGWSGRHSSAEGGMTVVELVVASAVLLLFSVMAFNFLINTNSIARRTEKDAQGENDARVALRQMTEDIRAADPITITYPSTTSCPSGATYPAGYSSCISFTVVHDALAGQTCPKSVITYGFVGGAIKRDKVDYNSSCTVITTATGKTVISGIVNGSGTSVFRYFDSTGKELTQSTNPPASSPAYQSAASVMVTLVVQYQRGATVTVSSTAALRNNRV